MKYLALGTHSAFMQAATAANRCFDLPNGFTYDSSNAKFLTETSVRNENKSQPVARIDENGHLGLVLDGSNGYYREELVEKVTCL